MNFQTGSVVLAETSALMSPPISVRPLPIRASRWSYACPPAHKRRPSSQWVAQFYTFLLDQPALWRTGGFRLKPIIALWRMSRLPASEAFRAAIALWQLLLDAPHKSSEKSYEPGFFHGRYNWRYVRRSYEAVFPASFVRVLKSTTWLPLADGCLKRPEDVCFSDLHAEFHELRNPELENLLEFKPDVIQQLAKEARL